MTYNAAKLAYAIKEKRGSQSMRSAAKEIGISTSTLSRIEGGQFEPRLSTYILLCLWLGANFETFIAGNLKHGVTDRIKLAGALQALGLDFEVVRALTHLIALLIRAKQPQP